MISPESHEQALLEAGWTQAEYELGANKLVYSCMHTATMLLYACVDILHIYKYIL